jgi:hypothetical protein
LIEIKPLVRRFLEYQAKCLGIIVSGVAWSDVWHQIVEMATFPIPPNSDQIAEDIIDLYPDTVFIMRYLR